MMISIEKPPLQELTHHGVMGMKCGHRKGSTTITSNSKKTETEDERKKRIKRNILIGAAAVGVTLAVAGGVYAYKKNNLPIGGVQTFRFGKIVDLNSLSTKDTTIPKGSKFYRMSTKSFEDYSTNGKIYVSHVKKDARIYKETMPGYFESWKKQGFIPDEGKSVYEHVMKSKNEIKVPSKKIMAEMYMKTHNVKEVDDGLYKNFMTDLNNKDNPLVTKFFDHVRSTGYNAVVDENDSGFLGKLPLILLNPKEDIVSSTVHKVRALEKIINVIML
jgi:hypothetical protein